MQSVKVHFEQLKEYRRFNIQSFQELYEKCLEVCSSVDMNFYYEDEENDWVSMGSEDEFKQAMSFFNKNRAYMFVQVKTKPSSRVTKVKDYVSETTSNLSKNFQERSSKMRKDFEELVKEIPVKFKPVSDFVMDIPNKVKPLEERSSTFAKKRWGEFEDVVREIPSKVKPVEEFVKDIPNKVKPIEERTTTFAKKRWGEFEDVVIEFPSKVKSVEDFVKDIPSKVKPLFMTSSHREFICDGCKCSPIIGTRYKSVTKKDFDLCEKEKGENSDSFDVFKVPGVLDSTYIPKEEVRHTYQIQMNLMEEMGLKNKELNIMMLEKHKGNIQSAMNELMGR